MNLNWIIECVLNIAFNLKHIKVSLAISVRSSDLYQSYVECHNSMKFANYIQLSVYRRERHHTETVTFIFL